MDRNDPIGIGRKACGRSRMGVFGGALSCLLFVLGTSATAQPLASPVEDPLAIDPASDPLVRMLADTAAPQDFRMAVARAVRRDPLTAEGDAGEREAVARRREAFERLLPGADLEVSRFDTLSRDFANDTLNLVERSRARRRTDVTLSFQQTVFDFGASLARLSAARNGTDAAGARGEAGRAQSALDVVVAWQQLFGGRTLVSIGEAAVDRQRRFRDDLAMRVKQGVNARGDLAQADSARAAAEARLAGFRRMLGAAEARYREATGQEPPPALARAPAPVLSGLASHEEVVALTRHMPEVRAAEAAASVAGAEARATRAERFPILTAGVVAGRYGVLETDRDYDVRAQFALRWKLFGGAQPRSEAADARASGADARARRAREEAVRDAEIAWGDVAALEQEQQASRAALIAARQTRDILAERFRVSRGTLFELLAAEERYAASAAQYVQSIASLDVARWTLARATGQMLPALGLDADRGI